MSVLIETEGHEQVKVRSAADVQRQWKMVGLFALVAVSLLWFWLDIDDPTVTYLLDNARGEEPKQLNADVVVIAGLVVTLVALVLSVLNLVPNGWPTVLAASWSGWRSCSASWSGTTPTSPAPASRWSTRCPARSSTPYRWSSGRSPAACASAPASSTSPSRASS